MDHGSLFTGIGGFDLGFERAGMHTRWQVENEPFCIQILEKHWPDVPRYGDILGVSNLPYVDVISGGFPCQDISNANPGGSGLDGSRSGLWHEMYRIVCEVKPGWIVVENVRRLLSINSGRDFATILGNLADAGYHATWQMLRASDVGAPHERARVFLVANRDSQRIEGFWSQPIQRVNTFSWCEDVRRVEDFRDRPDVPQPLICRKDNGLSFRMDAIGNAVMPQLAEWIGRRIVELD